ncbi:hypothetical protein NX059_000556 [Plenodomus lindquistii]|nr:hypothetical protein NX059_000556 [Plenodomus lindquistii]
MGGAQSASCSSLDRDLQVEQTTHACSTRLQTAAVLTPDARPQVPSIASALSETSIIATYSRATLLSSFVAPTTAFGLVPQSNAPVFGGRFLGLCYCVPPKATRTAASTPRLDPPPPPYKPPATFACSLARNHLTGKRHG